MPSICVILAIAGLSLFSTTAIAQATISQPCPLLGLTYPEPSDYASKAAIQSAVQSLQDAITSLLGNTSALSGSFDYTTTAFAVDLYSVQDDDPLFTYHFTPDALKAQHTVGVESIDSNSVLRVGSLSKLLTVYLYLAAAGDETWNQPVTKFVPELAAFAEQAKATSAQNNFDAVDWDSITVGALASQLAGLGRDAPYSPAFTQALEQLGLSAPSGPVVAECGNTEEAIPCNRTAFFNAFTLQHPVVLPFSTPIYSNAAFQILGYAMENITGQSMSDLFQNALVKPLGLNGTYYTVPPSTDGGFIPINASHSWWDADTLDEAPAGGYYSSVNDLRLIGKAMLNSTLLTPSQTRRWIKPHSFTSSLNHSVGAPWEIHRAPSDSVTWLYTKEGDLGAYAAFIALLPEYNIGFTVLAAGTDPVNGARVLGEMTAAAYVPAVESVGATDATSIYDGTYADPDTNSTITLQATGTAGLAVTNWTIAGQNILALLGSLNNADPQTQSLSVHLQYTGMKNKNGTVTAWRSYSQVLPQPVDNGAFSENCATWETIDSYTYGGIGLDEFLITLDATGSNAVSIEPRVLGKSLDKVATSPQMKMPRRLRRTWSA